MSSKAPLVYCVITLFVLNTIPLTHAFGSDLLEQLTDLLFGSDESSEESAETIINAKPNATLTVVCKTGCDLNVMCINCTNVNAVMMPPGNGNGSGNGGGNANGNGNGKTTPPAQATVPASMAMEATAASTSTTPKSEGKRAV
uniref:Putative salivary asparagine-rich mucin n=1 Tax=Culex quinquefasciatus TaxID=7176 RepID=Q6TS19_CULQU|nr:putative salivary asparagine-rich mucin [Culex quinquefasciatus]